MTPKTLGVALLTLSLFSGSAVAAQTDATEDPEALIRTGVKLRQAGDDVRAEGYFRRAYQVARTPRSATQLGLVEFALNNYADAEIHLSEGMESDDAWVGSHRDLLEQTRTKVREHLARVEISGGPPDATVTTGRLGPLKLRDGRVLWLMPGAISLRIEASGYAPETYSVNASIGQTTKVLVALRREQPLASAAAAVTSAADTRAAGSPRMRTAGLVTAGVGLAAGVAGIFLYTIGGSKRQSIEKAAAAHTPYDESNGNWKTYDRAGVGLIIGGGTVAITGVALYLIGRNSAAAASEVPVSLFVAPGFALAQVGGRF
jgi:hypothetical protein